MPTWNADEFVDFLCSVRAALPSSHFDWDLDAGEEWARILNSDEVDGLIRAPTTVAPCHRFAFVRSGSCASALLRPLLEQVRVEVVELDDFELPTLSVRADNLAAFVGPNAPPTHAFDPNRFSASDLWFVSV
jgi:hypothetical protein